MGYTSYLKPHPEVISDEGIEGIIDLANLKDASKTKIEARPETFFKLTYPTTDVIKVLEQIDLRFSSPKETSGLFLFEGLKGSGKSHLLLLIYNLFKHREAATQWLKDNDLTCSIPDDTVVIINKFTDDPHDAIWEMIFETLGARFKPSKTHPKLAEFEKALGDSKVVLIFDELEQGIKVIGDDAIKAQNIAFLQMLSEFSNRSRQITLFASIYSDKEEPGSTLKRVPRCVVQFDNTRDQSNIILHRLFENFRDFDKSAVSPCVESYVQLWQKHVPTLDTEEYKGRFFDTYPFSPALMTMILTRVPARGGFQNVRGALSFLGNMVRLTHSGHDIITPGDASLNDKANTIMLKDLDPSGDLISRARENMEDLKPRAPLSQSLAASVLLHTLTERGSSRGASREELILDLLSPSMDINAFEQTLIGFQKYASYFHHQEGRYYFDLEENAEAKVEFKSLGYSDEQAREKLYDIFKSEIFKETASTTVFTSVEQAQEILKQLDKSRPRYVLAGRRLTQEERHSLYFGMDNRNLILLLEPKDDKFQLATDKDLLKWAKRCLAARALADSTAKSARRDDYERILRSDQGYIVDRIRKAGLVFASWEHYGNTVSEDRVELELLPADCSKDIGLEKISQEYFDMLRIKEHLEGRLDQIREKVVKDIETEYRKTLGFPVPLYNLLPKALREMCREGIIGIQHSSGNFCHTNPGLTETELFYAHITAPFEKPPTPEHLCPKCNAWPCKCKPKGDPRPCEVCGFYPCQCEKPPEDLCPHCGNDPCTCPKPETVYLKIPPQLSIGNLRQEAASRLQPYDAAVVTRTIYKIFFQQNKVGDLSVLPAGIRGNLSGQGDITAEISITKAGGFKKAEIEQQIEALPVLSGAEYSADLTVEVTTP